jgi:sugar lactone lactonase YvrE
VLHAPDSIPPRPASTLRRPGRVLVDEHGNIWIADTGQHRILVADRHGTLRLVIGTGTPGAADGAHHEASFHAPHGLALTRAGTRLYVADTDAHTIRRIDVNLARGTATVTTVAGTGTPGTALPPGQHPVHTTALAAPYALALDDAHHTLYVAAARARQIWRLDLIAATLAPCAGALPDETTPGIADGPALTARLADPRGLALAPDRKRLYIADAAASAVRILHLDTAALETLVGTHDMSAGSADGPRQHARLRGCSDIALSPGGLVVADTGNHALRGINLRHGTVTTLWRGADEPGLVEPGAVAFERQARAYLMADTGQDRLVRVAADAARATVLTLAPAAAPAEQ